MVIEILNDTTLNGLPMVYASENTFQHNSNYNVENITFRYIISSISWISNSPLLLKSCHVHSS